MNKDDRAILYGMAIGDGSISNRLRFKDGKYPYVQATLSIAHGPKQREYLLHKKGLLESILGGKKLAVTKLTHKLKDKKYNTFRWSKTNKYFRQMHRVLYSRDGKKYITDKVLSYLDEHSLALWFLDDGTIRHNKNRQGEITSLGFELCTQCSEEEALKIVEWLKSFSIDSRVYVMKGKYNVRGATQATLMLCSIIEPYVPSSMLYKISPSFRFVYRKSARHPNFNIKKDDDIVQAT